MQHFHLFMITTLISFSLCTRAVQTIILELDGEQEEIPSADLQFNGFLKQLIEEVDEDNNVINLDNLISSKDWPLDKLVPYITFKEDAKYISFEEEQAAKKSQGDLSSLELKNLVQLTQAGDILANEPLLNSAREQIVELTCIWIWRLHH